MKKYCALHKLKNTLGLEIVDVVLAAQLHMKRASTRSKKGQFYSVSFMAAVG